MILLLLTLTRMASCHARWGVYIFILSDGMALLVTFLVILDCEKTPHCFADAPSLKFWSWDRSNNNASGSPGYVLNTRVEAPHKTEITALQVSLILFHQIASLIHFTFQFHPTQPLVVTGSRDRTFKLWEQTPSAAADASLAQAMQAEATLKAPKYPMPGKQITSSCFLFKRVPSAVLAPGQEPTARQRAQIKRSLAERAAAEAAIAAAAADSPSKFVW
jgi:hypothetical protein